MRMLICILYVFGLSSLTYAAGFELSSPELTANQMMPKRYEYSGYGCSGENKSPALSWTGAPPETRSFAVTVFDPDAPTGAGWWHWGVINIPANVQALTANAGALNSTSLPDGAKQLRSDFGMAAWGGPCPPPGDKPHHYIFTVYALKITRLTAPADATVANMRDTIEANMLAKAQFVALYGRAR